MTRTLRHSLVRYLPLLLIALCALTGIASAQEAAAPAAEAHPEGDSLITLFVQGGWVMYPLLVCSIAMVWLTVDTWGRTGVKKVAPPAQVAQMQDLFRSGDYVGAYQFAKNNNSPFCDVSRVCLSFAGDGEEAVDAALFAEINKVNAAIQTRINYLSVIGVCTPMIGLIGTVAGMKGAFAELGKSGASDVGALSGHIGEVLVATATGLVIAVPAFLVFYFLRNRLQGGMGALQEVTQALFRKMPYEHLKGAHVGEEEFYAAVPNWVAGGGDHAAAPAAA
jgi:biopolymer transport protein ExbB